MKLNDLRRYAKKSLQEAGIPDADSSKLELLFEYAFNFSRNFILREPDHEIEEGENLAKFREALASVCAGTPVQYAVGFSYFCGYKFFVDKNVLIPRLETELLVEIGAGFVSKLFPVLGRPVKVLDLCSGSGAVGIALKKKSPGCDVTLSDISSGAISVSKKNAASLLEDENAVKYVTGSFLEPFLSKADSGFPKFDVVLSNPPYIPTDVIKTLPRDVRDYEPRLALDGGAGGLVPYDKITHSLSSVCTDFGVAVFEIGEDQGNSVKALLRSRGFAKAEVVKDLDEKDRFVAGTKAGAVLSEHDPLFNAHRTVLNGFRDILPSGRVVLSSDSKNANTAVLSEARPIQAPAVSDKKLLTADPGFSHSAKPVKEPPAAKKEPSTEKPRKQAEPLESSSDTHSGPDKNSPVSAIKGVGPKTEAALNKLGITTVSDLLSFYPSGYEDRKTVRTVREVLAGLSIGESAFSTLLLRVNGLTERGNPRNPVFVFNCSDSTGEIDVVFFNNRYVKKMLRLSGVYYFYGKIKKSADFFGSVSMQQPRFVNAASPLQVKDFLVLAPVYKTGGKVGNKEMSNAVKAALLICGKDADGIECEKPDIPEEILKKYGLPSRRGLLRSIHFPENPEDANAARRRVEFENLLESSLNMQALKHARDLGLPGIAFNKSNLGGFLEKLPFSLTKGQLSVIEKIFEDMSLSRPMNRLINGDVGSGKTVIALAAIYNAVSNGRQAALMVPSTVLAAQHMAKTSSVLSSLGIPSEMLRSSTKASDRKRILKRIESGEPLCIIGTHSLISENVNFKNLGLAVIDEQHRFGVLQRAKLMEKSGETVPDVLSLTATPIPRSLALVLYGDMDISALTEKPGGRLPVATYLYSRKDRPAIYRRALELVKSGGQVYIVHAKIDKNDNDDPLDANSDELLGCVENYRQMSETVFAGIKTGLIHGKLSDSEKQAAMDAFSSGETKVLFSTTVIEVGVDVPEASLIIIEDAERFGLSTLHQLRGRVGRGTRKSYCILISDKSSERLEVMTETNDGFKIAEKDLELRGPGDFFGTAQTGAEGAAALAVAADPRLLEKVKEAADYIVKKAESGENRDFVEYYKAVTVKAGRITL